MSCQVYFVSSAAVEQQSKMYTYYKGAIKIIRHEGLYASHDRGSK